VDRRRAIATARHRLAQAMMTRRAPTAALAPFQYGFQRRGTRTAIWRASVARVTTGRGGAIRVREIVAVG